MSVAGDFKSVAISVECAETFKPSPGYLRFPVLTRAQHGRIPSIDIYRSSIIRPEVCGPRSRHGQESEHARRNPVRSGSKTQIFNGGCGTSQSATVARLRLRDARCTPEREEGQCNRFYYARRPRNLLTGDEPDLRFGKLEAEETSRMSTRPWDLCGLREKADRDRSRPKELWVQKVQMSCDLRVYEEGNDPRRAARYSVNRLM